MKLIADFSHFCVVSESNLEDQKELLERVLPNIKHIHARVGFEQSPQVNNPFAPEWENHLNRYMNWWKKIIEIKIPKNMCRIITKVSNVIYFFFCTFCKKHIP